MVDELLDLVNEKDEVIGTVWKSAAHKNPALIHREVAIVVKNEKGELLLQQRSVKKKHHPGRWALTAGHVGQGEKPELAAKRELEEELNLHENLRFVGKLLLSDEFQVRFFWIYLLIVKTNMQITINQKEISDIKWIRFEDLNDFSKKNDYRLDGSTHKIISYVLKNKHETNSI